MSQLQSAHRVLSDESWWRLLPTTNVQKPRRIDHQPTDQPKLPVPSVRNLPRRLHWIQTGIHPAIRHRQQFIQQSVQ